VVRAVSPLLKKLAFATIGVYRAGDPDELGIFVGNRPLRTLVERPFSLWRVVIEKGGPQAAFSVRKVPVLLDDDLDAAVLRLAHVVAGRHQQLALALADDRDRLGRHAVADQRILDCVGAAQ
jgi:hypothetical protein